RDMTKAKEAFAAAQRMAAIVEHSEDAIIGRTLDGAITSWNPAAERMFQYSGQEIVGQSSDLLTSVDRAAEIRSLMTRIRTGHPVERVETIGVRKDGSVFPASLTLSPIRDADGVVIGASTIARDVTEAKLAQLEIAEQRAVLLERLAELDRANADLLSVNKVMQGFIDVAAHDLRTPLSSVVGYSDLLTEGWTTLDEDTKLKFAATINRQSHNLAGLVNDLLTLSSIEGGAAAIRPRAVVVAEAISSCLEKLGARIARVSVSCSPDLVALVDPTHLGRIIDNYLSNALDHGGPPVSIDATRHDGTVEIRVVDHGPGVPAEFLPRLFDTFAQADSWGARGRGGAGLGLSIAGGLARVNGGHASYQPNAAGGSCFIVILPAQDPNR
ncbi:MAG: PAS domain-containing sensor histidine kinase, partial [Dermatophilaceae bacterium]